MNSLNIKICDIEMDLVSYPLKTLKEFVFNKYKVE